MQMREEVESNVGNMNNSKEMIDDFQRRSTTGE
jgi:hypothetical protein